MQQFLKKLPYFLCYLVAFAFGIKQMREPDIWWQLLSGRWMLEHGAVTRTDVFSYTMQGAPWVNVKWLYEIIIATIEHGFGPEGVMLLQAIVNVGILWALFKVLKHMRSRLQIPASGFFTVIVALLFFVIVEYRMAGRPEMVSHLMCAVYLAYLWRNPELKWKQLPVLVILQCLWANMHEGYPVGMVIIGAYMGASLIAYLLRKEKAYLQSAARGAALFVLSALAILANPNGIQLWKQPFEIYRQVQVNKYTTELFSWQQPEYWTIQAKIYIGLLLLTIMFWIVRLLQAKKEKDNRFYTPVMITNLLLILLFGYLSLGANRNIIFAAIALFPSIPFMMAWLLEKAKLTTLSVYQTMQKNSWALGGIVALILYINIVNDNYYKATESANRFGLQISTLHNPTGAVDFIRQHNIKGVAFSDYFISSYLLWAMYPEFKSYIDLRDLDVFPKKFFDDYFDLYNNPSRFTELDKKYNFNYVVLSGSQQSAVQQKLYWGEGYNMIYADPVCMIFLKMTPENESLNRNISVQKLFSWPPAPETPGWATGITHLLNPAYEEDPKTTEAYLPVMAGKFYNGIGNHPIAVKMLLPEINNYTDDAEAMCLMGSIYGNYASSSPSIMERNARGDSAMYYLLEARDLDPKMAQVYLALGNLYMMSGKFTEAEKELRTYTEMKPNEDYIQYKYGVCNYYVWLNTKSPDAIDRMQKAMERSLKVNPENGKAWLYISFAQMEKGKREDARVSLDKAIKSDSRWVVQEDTMINNLKVKTGL